jgi:hypothetical protein
MVGCKKRTEPMSTEKKYVPLLLIRSAATEKDKKLRPLKLPDRTSQKQYVPLTSALKQPVSSEKVCVPLQPVKCSQQLIPLKAVKSNQTSLIPLSRQKVTMDSSAIETARGISSLPKGELTKWHIGCTTAYNTFLAIGGNQGNGRVTVKKFRVGQYPKDYDYGKPINIYWATGHLNGAGYLDNNGKYREDGFGNTGWFIW